MEQEQVHQIRNSMRAAGSEIRNIDELLNRCSVPYAIGWQIKEQLNNILLRVSAAEQIAADEIKKQIVELEEKNHILTMPDGSKLKIKEGPASPEIIELVVLPGQGALLQQEGRE